MCLCWGELDMETPKICFILKIMSILLMAIPCNGVTVSEIRLRPSYQCTGTTDAKYGTVEVKVNGEWTTIHYGYGSGWTGYYWHNNEATVACRSLGFRYGRHIWTNKYDVASKYTFVCSGIETNLTQCKSYIFSGYTPKTADVICFNRTVPITSTRLLYTSDSSDGYGRVDVKVCGKWGSVYDRYWDKKEADVICRQMGFKHGGKSSIGNVGKEFLWYLEVNCTGTEDSLSECSDRNLTQRNYYGNTGLVLCYKPAVVHISSVNGSMTIREGRELTLTCVVDSAIPGVASNRYRWKKDGNKIFGQSSSAFSIKRVDKSDKGYYQCAGDNEAGSGNWSTIVQVRVDYLSSVSIETSISRNGVSIEDHVQYNDKVTLTCSVSSNPASSISWYKYDQILTNCSTDNRQYIIDAFTCLDNGVYFCHVTNDAIKEWRTSEIEKLFVKLQPDAPSNVNYLQAGVDSICLVWEAMCEGGDQERFIVQHSTDDNSWTDSTSISTVYYCVENLEPDTLYYIRVLARNRYGDSRSVYLVNEGKRNMKTLRKDEPANVGMIIGILVAVLVIIAGSVILAIFIYKKRKIRKSKKDTTYEAIDVRNKQNEIYQQLKINKEKKPKDNVYVNTIKIQDDIHVNTIKIHDDDSVATGRGHGKNKRSYYVNATVH